MALRVCVAWNSDNIPITEGHIHVPLDCLDNDCRIQTKCNCKHALEHDQLVTKSNEFFWLYSIAQRSTPYARPYADQFVIDDAASARLASPAPSNLVEPYKWKNILSTAVQVCRRTARRHQLA